MQISITKPANHFTNYQDNKPEMMYTRRDRNKSETNREKVGVVP